MARYTASRTKLSRRVGRNLFLKGSRSFSPKDDFTKRPFKAPKKKGKRVNPTSSEYSKQLLEKQALKFTYGLLEKQLTNLFKKAFKKKGDTGSIALSLLERRLDSVIYRSGLANSRSQARQLVNHGHFLVNGKKANIPSITLEAGDLIKLKENKSKKTFWQSFTLEIPNDVPVWLQKKNDFEIKVVNSPLEDDLPKEFNISSIVEYYSNKVA
jgi:small subunit ribosomal protein S4